MSETQIFILRVIASFFAGGIYIAGTTVIAEKVSPRLAGILVALPTTVLIAFSFLTLTTSLEETGEVAGSAPAVIGGSILFLLTYVELRDRPIALKLTLSILVWLAISSVVALTHTTNVAVTMGVCVVAVALASYRFHFLENMRVDRIHYSKGEILTRFILAGSVIAFAIILARISGTIWGAVFSAFPATFTSTLIIIDRRHGHKIVASMSRSMPYGSLGTALFAVSFHYLSEQLSFLITVSLSYLVSVIFTFSVVYGKDWWLDRRAVLGSVKSIEK